MSPGSLPGICHSGGARAGLSVGGAVGTPGWPRTARIAGLGDEGDDPHLAAALRAQQWQHLLDADQQQRPDMARRFAMRRLRRVANRPLRLGLCSRVSGDDIGLYERPRQCGNCRS